MLAIIAKTAPYPVFHVFSLVRTAWKAKGTVISTEMRAFNNHYGKRGLGHYTGIAGFGKYHANAMQHTRHVLPSHTHLVR